MILAGTVACFSVLFKPAVIRTDHETRLAAFFRWQSGEIRFINSITERPVAIGFNIGRRFHAFTFTTDETTQAYYTSGLYDLSQAVANESTDRLQFCSVKGLSVTIGFQTIVVQDGCLEVALLWTMW